MKNIILLLIVLILSSCNTTKTVIDPTTMKEVKVFENENFSFFYPAYWKNATFKNHKDNLIARLSLNNKQMDLLLAQYAYNVNSIKKDLKNEPFATSSPISYIKISVYLMPLENENMELYLANRTDSFNKRFGNEKGASQQTSKIDATHYIRTARFKGIKNDFGFHTTQSLTHYYKLKNKILILNYFATTNNFSKYIEDISYIVRSLKLKTTQTDSTPPQKP